MDLIARFSEPRWHTTRVSPRALALSADPSARAFQLGGQGRAALGGCLPGGAGALPLVVERVALVSEVALLPLQVGEPFRGLEGEPQLALGGRQLDLERLGVARLGAQPIDGRSRLALFGLRGLRS